MSSKRHHYIPVFYLSEWATGKPKKLWQMSRGYNNGSNNGIAFKHSSPAAMGYKDDLYAILSVGDELKQWLEENFFQRVDDEASVAMRELVGGNTDLKPKLRQAWARFIMSLMSRTPDKIEDMRNAYEEEAPNARAELIKAYDMKTAGRDPPPTEEEKAFAIEQGFNLGLGTLIQKVMDLPDVGTAILQMFWIVITIPDGGRGFITSDKPVHLSKGLQYEDAFFALPISPRKLFVASKTEAILLQLRSKNWGDLVQATNLTAVQQAIRYVYAADKLERNFIARNLRH